MNRNYVERRIWTDKYVHEHHAYDKNNAGYVNVGSFPQQIQCHCKMRKCVDEQLCANVQSLVTKQPIFVSKRNSIEKETSEIFDCTRLFSLQNLNSTITFWELFFRSVGSYFFFQTFIPTMSLSVHTIHIYGSKSWLLRRAWKQKSFKQKPCPNVTHFSAK